jgi:hypothetical protein
MPESWLWGWRKLRTSQTEVIDKKIKERERETDHEVRGFAIKCCVKWQNQSCFVGSERGIVVPLSGGRGDWSCGLEEESIPKGWQKDVGRHLHKHLGSASLGPAGGAQGNKQLWFENLTVSFGAQGKQGNEQDGVCHLLPSYFLLFYLTLFKSLPHCATCFTYKNCKCKNKPQIKLTK